MQIDTSNVHSMIEFSFLETDQSKYAGFVTLAQMYFGESDSKKVWGLIKSEFKKDTKLDLPYPLNKDRALCTEIKKWMAVKTYKKLNPTEI